MKETPKQKVTMVVDLAPTHGSEKESYVHVQHQLDGCTVIPLSPECKRYIVEVELPVNQGEGIKVPDDMIAVRRSEE